MRLTIKLHGPYSVEEVPLEPQATIVLGRSRRADHTLLDQSVSSSHCQLVYEENRLFIRDLESKNGTFVNGVRIESSPIYVGDEVRLGKTKVTVVQEKSDQEALKLLKSEAKVEKKNNDLKLDFTGLRHATEFAELAQKYSNNSPHPMANRPFHRSPSERRAPSNSKKMLSSLASTIDLILCLLSISAPLLLLNILLMMDIPYVKENRLITLVISEVVIVGAFLVTNFWILKNSLGEKFVGLDKEKD